MSYLIDTNIIIYYFNGLTNDESLHSILANNFKISIITKIEFLGWGQFLSNQNLYIKAKSFIHYATIFDINDAIAEQTILLRQQFKTKTPDAIIAATAMVKNLTVVTNNTDDFNRLGIKTISVTMQ
uniref:Nucleic acid-binding protein,contains PIN domain n=1 Tax=Chlorobium chlorochromatii (strain CaD3) TaxID=340177 RepID=Q3AQS8_CHLCH